MASKTFYCNLSKLSYAEPKRVFLYSNICALDQFSSKLLVTQLLEQFIKFSIQITHNIINLSPYFIPQRPHFIVRAEIMAQCFN